MVKIVGGSGTGKTKELMLKANECDGVFVCSNVDKYRTKAYTYGISNLTIISYDELNAGEYDADKKVFINKVDKYILTLCNVAGITLTTE
jgi:hypothetical protein